MSDHVNDGEDGSGFDVRWLITGGRDWTDRARIRNLLLELRTDVEGYAGHELVIVHGDCPNGADAIAKELCAELGIRTSAFPVDHALDGPWPAAGPRRSGRMIKASMPLAGWIAFWSGKCDHSGTLACMSQATSQGVPGQVIPQLKGGSR